MVTKRKPNKPRKMKLGQRATVRVLRDGSVALFSSNFYPLSATDARCLESWLRRYREWMAGRRDGE